ncbi:MAG: hypothetical protein MUD02_04840 [Bacteroidales bacterium]|jgi:hypothetical protein|nr:hypothetical protein [Bacteroidales bacterium]MCU0408258.1 hypothetical protein [Bacteroidales bacterium]
MKRILKLVFVVILIAPVLSGCRKDKGDPPVLPPAGSMVIDFSNFASSGKGSAYADLPKGTENSTYEFAALVAGVWKLIINTTLFVPVTAFNKAFSQTPEWIDDNLWQWSYTFEAASVSYTARLTGQIGTTEVIWKMYITKTGNGAFTDFLWFEGTSKTDGSSGQWILYQSAQAPQACLQVDWTRNGDEITKVKYTWIKNNDPFKTSYIEYSLFSVDLDAYFLVRYYTGTKFSDVEIRWNTVTKNGQVRSSDYLENKWYCWDSNKINVVCPAP